MKKYLLIFIFYGFYATAQVGIGTTVPNGALDVTSTNNGLLLPRIGLTSTTDAVTVVNQITSNPLVNGTAIYNTATSGVYPNNVSPGFYYWNTNKWERINNGTKTELATNNTVAAPNSNMPNTYTGSNSTASTFDLSTQTRLITITGATGTTTLITCNVQISHSYAADIDLYLQSPTGQIIELSTDNGPFAGTNFNVTFADSGATNITSWTTGNVSGTYRPEGTLTTDVLTPTITTMAGFNGNSPNGNWTLHLRDDFAADFLNFIDFSLTIETNSTSDYRLVSEIPVIYKAGHDVLINSAYSANCSDSNGVITAITASTSSAGAIGTAVTDLTSPSYTKLSYTSNTAKSISKNHWLSSRNQAISSGLTDGTTYYYQLWAKGNIETPLSSNEQWSMAPIQLQK
ncbi:proprotein convertase P-domain-containing protein [Flavobacterium sp. N2820]|uniref:proprotein convertase P-domain-containing protein n=1 Tax=Flavobacterium sp. N2820 TaxID=2986834 RepID=UPI002224FEBB|nr:proprotein convertase P-domain-containing protein [Flavobacterium sp. N2820]